MNMSPRSPVSLLPIFRSQAQYRLIGELFTNPGREFSIGELAELVGASHPTISREVERLTEAALLTTRDQGRRRLVAAREDSPVYAPLRDLVSRTYGVPAVIREEFADLQTQVAIFGSFAERWAGRPGPTPADVDVLVLGDVDPTDAWEAAARASERLGIEVSVTVRTTDEWDRDASGFAASVKGQPLISLTDDAQGIAR